MRLKKLLAISFILVLFTVMVSAYFPNTPLTSSSGASGKLVNICGGWPSDATCSGCNDNTGECWAPSGGRVERYTCDQGEEAYENGGLKCERNQERKYSGSYNINADICQVQQVDVFDASGNLKDFVVWKADQQTDCNPAPVCDPDDTITFVDYYGNSITPQEDKSFYIRAQSDVGYQWVVSTVNGQNQGGPDRMGNNGRYYWDWKYTATSPGTYSVYFYQDAVNDDPSQGVVCKTKSFTIEEAKGSIAGHKYNKDTQKGLSGWTIRIKKGGVVIKSTTTDYYGRYSFTDLAPDSYVVEEVMQSGWTVAPGYSASYSVVVQPDRTTTVDFYNTEEKGSIAGHKYEYISSYQKEGLQGWTIRLKKNNVVIRTATTGWSGAYAFTDVPAGTYVVEEVMQSGWAAAPGYSTSYSVVVNNDDVSTVDFYNVQKKGTIRGFKYNKETGASLPGWTIRLKKDGSVIASTTTSVNGDYQFNIAPGTYVVEEVMQSGWTVAPGYSTSYSVVVQSDKTSTVNFYNIKKKGSISGHKYEYGTNEKLSGWTIKLKKDGNVIRTATTDSYGAYSFQDVTADTYVVEEVMQSGWAAAPGYSASYSVIVKPGQNTVRDFYNTKVPGYITGHKFEYGTDKKLSGWTIRLKKDGNVVKTDVTDAYGRYEFKDVDHGTYVVEEVMQDGWEVAPGYAKSYTIVMSGQATSQNFYNVQKTSTISGYKYNDDTGNRLSGWTIRLKKDGNVVKTDVTDAYGHYRFSGIDAGTYVVEEVMQTGWTVAPGYAKSYTVTIQPGEHKQQHFKNVQEKGSISGYKIEYGTNEKLSGWTIRLKKDGNVVKTDVTDAYGHYRFSGIDAGTYVVEEVMQTGWTVAPGYAKSYTITVKSGQNTDRDFYNQKILGCIDGYKTDDKGDGLQGWTIQTSAKSTKTNADGYYKIDEIAPGTYTVEEIMQSGWEPISAPSKTVTVNADACTRVNFANRKLPTTGCVEGIKRNDNHVGLTGWNIKAKKVGSSTVYETVSGQDGRFSFEGLPPGEYEFWEIMQEGWEPVTAPKFTADVEVGDQCTQIAFKNRKLPEPGCIEGKKIDNESIGLPLWKIYAKEEATGEIMTSRTDGTGKYAFEELDAGYYTVWEEHQIGWEPVTDDKVTVQVKPGVCEEVTFMNKQVPVCQDECSAGQSMCTGDELLTCGNFDADECLEWGQKQDCSFTEESDVYYTCQENDKVGYKDITEGFCNDQTGLQDYCDEKTYTEKVETIDCGEDTSTEPFCDGQNIVQGETQRGCTEESGQAECYVTGETTIIDECGPDVCTPFTEKDPFTKEYVEDLDSCEIDAMMCTADPGLKYDYCAGDTVYQAVCTGTDHAYEPFDCNQKDGCYEFPTTTCEKCFDPYSGQCCDYEKEIMGQEYRDYTCGDGACTYTTEMQDSDNDQIDDRCDTCIDKDHDGVCDDADNCPGVYNPNQVDKDDDGKGNMCDDDKDNDGYPTDLDCNDWNADINPGAEEIHDNGIDDDCNPDTVDRTADTPRQILYIDALHDDVLTPGDYETFVISVTNNAGFDLKDVQVSVTLQNNRIYQRKLIEDLKTGNTETEVFQIYIPAYAQGYEYLRIAVSDDDYQRTIYREVQIA